MENQQDAMKKTALISGARSGIGLALTKRLLNEGWRVITLNRSPFSTEDEIIRSALESGNLVQYLTDLSDFRQLKAALERVKEMETHLDILFNNAGSMSGKLTFSLQGREVDFEINTVAPFIVLKELEPLLIKGSFRTVINTSSNAALKAKQFAPDKLAAPSSFTKLFGSYASSKLALSLWTQAIAPKLAQSNLKIRSVDPGPTRTPLSRSKGMPFLFLLVSPFFSSTEQAAAKIYDAAFGKFKGENGVFVMGGKKATLKFLDKKKEILAMLDLIYQLEYKKIQ